jgi:hypothetical protein
VAETSHMVMGDKLVASVTQIVNLWLRVLCRSIQELSVMQGVLDNL